MPRRHELFNILACRTVAHHNSPIFRVPRQINDVFLQLRLTDLIADDRKTIMHHVKKFFVKELNECIYFIYSTLNTSLKNTFMLIELGLRRRVYHFVYNALISDSQIH